MSKKVMWVIDSKDGTYYLNGSIDNSESQIAETGSLKMVRESLMKKYIRPGDGVIDKIANISYLFQIGVAKA